MRFAHRFVWLSAMLLTIGATAQAADAPVTISAGEWSATIGPRGLALTYGGDVVSQGSYLTIFTPEYKGNVLTSRAAWDAGTTEVSDGGRTVSLSADLPGGAYVYRVTLYEDRVQITLRACPVADADIGQIECAILQMPEQLLTGATIETVDAAGSVSASLTVPEEPRRGGLAGGGAGMILKTAAHTICVDRLDFGTVYPYDARDERYGTQRGIWAFTSLPFQAGQETVAECELRIAPAAPARPPGAITLAPGAPATAVLTPANATAREMLAADELVAYLEAIAGRRLSRAEYTGATPEQGAILVGAAAVQAGLIAEDALDAVAPDGYVVKVEQGRVGICGPRDVGTVYGAYALLRHLGCRFYAPGCESIPQLDALVIPEITLAASPFYEFRQVTGNLKLGHTPSDDLMNPREIGASGNIVHSASYLLPYDEYHEQHPEYFALQKDGRRLTRDPDAQRFDVHLCLSNPDVHRICAERMLALMDIQHDRKFFGVSQGDGYAWCECEQCRALDAVPGVDMTDRLLEYVNSIARDIAQKYPDKRILTLAYTNATSPPPTRVMPEPNVMVQYCPYPPRTGCQSHDLTCEQNAQSYTDLMGWLQKCPENMYIFDYPTGYANWYEPFGSFWAMKRKLDLYSSHGVRGIYYCGTPKNFNALFIYVQSRLLWQPDAAVEPLIDEFMAAYYGAAAPQVREYFDYMHREIDERPVHQMCEGASPHTVTPEWADKALDMLGRAEDAVRDDRARLYRVRAEKLCVLFGDLNARNPINGSLAVSGDVFAQRLAEFCAIGRTMRIGQFTRRLTTDEWLYRVARIRPQRSPWYSDPLIERLVADPVQTLAAEQTLYSQVEVSAGPMVEVGGAGGWRLELQGFRGARGPEQYAHECPPREAVWIYGTNTRNPQMWTALRLEKAPRGQARLVLTAQDDDKPGAVRIRIAVNGQPVFEGENRFVERGWSTEEVAIPPGILKQGENEIRFVTLDESSAADQGWFMLAECMVLVEGE